MSRGLICDQCGVALSLNAKGENENGEEAAWLHFESGAFSTGWDACSRSCATQLLVDGGPLAQQLDAELETISAVVRMIQEGHEDDPEDDPA